MKLRTILNHCITGIDGETIDPARFYLGLAVFVFLGGAIVNIIHTKALDYQTFGIGFGLLLAGGGLGIAIKSKTEPGQT